MQELHTNENDSMEGNLPDTLYDLRVTPTEGKFSVNLPPELIDAHGFDHKTPVSFTPRINVDLSGDAEVSFLVHRIDGYDVDPDQLPDEVPDADEDELIVPFGHRNEMRMWSKYRAGRLNVPLEFATGIDVDTPGESVSLYEAASEDALTADVESRARGVIELRFNPPAMAWTIPNDGGRRAFEYNPTIEWPVTKTPVSYKAGPDTKYDALRLEIPHEFAHESVLDLDGGEPVANRLAQIDGEPVLVFDFAVEESEMNDRHVRTLMKSDWIKVGGSQYDQFRALFSPRWAYAFGWDGDTELAIEPGPDRFLVAEDGVL